MSNIFDGHEDKTPEELAKELGISDLSVVDNAGKETIKVISHKSDIVKMNNNTIKNNPFCNFVKLRQSEIDDETLWTSNTTYLEEGMRVIYNGVGKIVAMHDEGIIIIKYKDETTKHIDFNEEVTELKKYTPDLEMPDISAAKNLNFDESWTHDFKISELERNIRFKDINSEKVGRILDIDNDNDSIKVFINNEIKQYSNYDFERIIRLYKEDFDKLKIKQLSSNGVWINNYSLENLEKGVYVKNNKGLFVVETIEDTKVRIKTGPYTLSYMKFKDFSKKYELYVADGEKESIENNDLWTYNYSMSDVKKTGKFLEKELNTTGTIIEVGKEEEKVKIKLDGDTKEVNLSFNLFMNTCSIPKKARAPFIGLSLKNKDSINSWGYLYDTEKLEIGVRILHVKNSKVGKILGIDTKENEIELIMEDGTTNNVDFRDFTDNYGVYKDDLESIDMFLTTEFNNWMPIQNAFEIKRGVRIKDLDDSLYWVIDVNYEDISLRSDNEDKIIIYPYKKLQEDYSLYSPDFSIP